MGLTISDRDKIMYVKWRKQGMTHEEAINQVPEKMRGRFIKNLEMSPIESHFGMSEKCFFISIGVVIIGGIIFILCLL